MPTRTSSTTSATRTTSATSTARGLRRGLAVGAVAAGAVVASATGALAHVSVTPTVTEAGAYSLLTFAVPHGCDGSPTTRISIEVPEALVTVTPTVNPGWTVKKVMTTLPTPVDDGHGGQYTERVSEVVYTARTPLPDGYRDTLTLQAKLPEKAGETLSFPTVQTCEKGETAWVQVPAAGEDEDSLEHPVPAVLITKAAAADTAETASATTVSSMPVSAAVATSSTSPVAWAGLALGAAGAVLGGAAFVRSSRKPA